MSEYQCVKSSKLVLKGEKRKKKHKKDKSEKKSKVEDNKKSEDSLVHGKLLLFNEVWNQIIVI